MRARNGSASRGCPVCRLPSRPACQLDVASVYACEQCCTAVDQRWAGVRLDKRVPVSTEIAQRLSGTLVLGQTLPSTFHDCDDLLHSVLHVTDNVRSLLGMLPVGGMRSLLCPLVACAQPCWCKLQVCKLHCSTSAWRIHITQELCYPLMPLQLLGKSKSGTGSYEVKVQVVATTSRFAMTQ
jgi:hypothetical protein